MSGNTRKNQVTRLVTVRHRSIMSGALSPGGALALIVHTVTGRTRQPDPGVPAIRHDEIKALVAKYLGSARRAGQGTALERTHRFEDVLAGTRFGVPRQFSGERSPRYVVFIVGLAPEAGLLDADRGWVRGLWEALRPHAIGSGDGYINGLTDFRRPGATELPPGQVRTASRDQGPVRSGQPVPPQRQHTARLTSPGICVWVRNLP